MIDGVIEPYTYKFEVLRPLKPAVVQFELRSLLNSVQDTVAGKTNVEKVLQKEASLQQVPY